MKRILVLDPESSESRRVVSLLETKGYLPTPISDITAIDNQTTDAVAVICCSTRLAAVFERTRLPILIVDAAPTIRSAVTAIRTGAADYLPLDLTADELGGILSRLEHGQSINPAGSTNTSDIPMFGISPPMKLLLDSISKVAPTDSSVLITGESGTGKELVARALHAGSERRTAPLISLNCATVPDDLIDAELFGHSGEEAQGLLATAAGGTLFLDEIGELPGPTQTRLLRALESDQKVRLISATHRDLDRLVATGQFRDDLYYRLKVISLDVPPLRERGDDILLLADQILARTMAKLGKQGLEFGADTRADMRRYPWPGNVRELENAVQRAVILCDGASIETSMLAIELPKVAPPEPSGSTSPDQTIEDYFVSFVTAHQDNMTETELAEKLGISRKSLWERRQRLNIPRKKTRKRGRRRDVS